MTIRIDGGVVVGWSGKNHELIPDGSVLIDGDALSYVGTVQSRPADQVITQKGRLFAQDLSTCMSIPNSMLGTTCLPM